jgi:hypothetical protein
MQEHITLTEGSRSEYDRVLSDLEWLKKTVEFTKSFSEYLQYMKTNALGGYSISSPCTNEEHISAAIPELGAIMGEQPSGEPDTEFRMEKAQVDHIPIEDFDSYNIKIKQNSPFLVYKERCKVNYRRIITVMKNLYKTAMNIPDVDKVIYTIEHDFNTNTHIYLKNPEFIFDDYIYHVYSYNNIVNNYTAALNVLNVFEYLFYKTTNYFSEIEYDCVNP